MVHVVLHNGAFADYTKPSGPFWMLLPFVILLVLYLVAVLSTNRRYKPWPFVRTLFWSAGLFAAAASITGPIVEYAHHDFRYHMIGHLMLGMLSPLLIAMAAPVTLLLRTLPVQQARFIARILRSRPAGILTNPIIASLLNIGGLWLLYTTNLYIVMQQSVFVHILIHAHMFLAGYVFTISMIQIDPSPHRTSFLYRAIVWVLALAAHGILSKWLYAWPPPGVPPEQAKPGGMIMYYGGDAIELIIICIVCFQWFKATGRTERAAHLHFSKVKKAKKPEKM